MKRYGMVIGLKPEKLDEYKRLHAAVWPGVLKTIAECNIRNYSIFLLDTMLFSYFEYVGTDFAADMAKMSNRFRDTRVVEGNESLSASGRVSKAGGMVVHS